MEKIAPSNTHCMTILFCSDLHGLHSLRLVGWVIALPIYVNKDHIRVHNFDLKSNLSFWVDLEICLTMNELSD